MLFYRRDAEMQRSKTGVIAFSGRFHFFLRNAYNQILSRISASSASRRLNPNYALEENVYVNEQSAFEKKLRDLRVFLSASRVKIRLNAETAERDAECGRGIDSCIRG